MAKPNTSAAVAAPATAPSTETPLERAKRLVSEAKAAQKAALKAAREEAAKIDPDYAGPGCGVLVMLTKSERDAFNAYCEKRGKSAREVGRDLLLAAMKGN